MAVRTQAVLLQFFADNVTGDITGEMMRDFVDTAFALGKPTITAIQTADYTAGYGEIVRVDTSGGALQVTLPAATGNGSAYVTLKNVSDDATNAVTCVPSGAETVEGGSSFVVSGARCVQSFVSFDDGVGGAGWMAFDGIQTPPAPPDPLPIQEDVAAWFHADDVSTLTLVSSTHVDTWIDDAGNGYSVTQATDSKRPIYMADFGDGLPALQLTSASVQHLQKLGSRPINPNNDYTIILLIQATSGVDSKAVMSIADSTAANRHLQLQYLFGQAKHRLLADAGTDNDFNTAMTADAWHIVVMRRNGSTLKTRVDAGAENTLPASGTVTTNSLTIGGLETGAGGVGTTFGGYIREVQFYATHKDDTARDALVAELMTRWNM